MGIETSEPLQSRPAKGGEQAAVDKRFAEVHEKELEYVRERREAVEPGSGNVASLRRPSTANRLVGLAFSGGGIRSATFHLGVLQALHRWGVLKQVDLLSTVSGGGFIGSSLTSQMSQGGGFPFEGESAAVVHLRNNSNYLAPRGFLDYLRMFAVLVRGIILNFLVLVPFLLIPCLIATVVYGPQLLSRLQYDETVERMHRYLEAAAVADQVRIAGGRQVAPLMTLLKKRGFVLLGVAQNDLRISDALQKRDPSYREITEPLITGIGSKSVPHTFLPGVTLREVAIRLHDAKVLEDHDVIEEVQAVELFLRTNGVRLGGAGQKVDGARSEDVGSFIRELSAHLPRPESSDPKPFMAFVSAQTLRQVLVDSKIIEKEGAEADDSATERREGQVASAEDDPLELAKYRFAADEGKRIYSLTQILQAFYYERLFDRRWLDLNRSAAHDEGLRYRWPNDEAVHLEVEAASLALWDGFDGLWDERLGWTGSVADLFEHLETRSESGAGAAAPTKLASSSKGSGAGKRPSSGKAFAASKFSQPLLAAEFESHGRSLLAAMKASGVVTMGKEVCEIREPSQPSSTDGPNASPATGGVSSAEPSTPRKPFAASKISAAGSSPKKPFATSKTASSELSEEKPFASREAAPSGLEQEPLGGCRLDPAFGLLRLAPLLYKQELYNRKWFLEREPWRQKETKGSRFRRFALWRDDPPSLYYQSERGSRDLEIEVARRALDLRPGETVAQTLKRLISLSDALTTTDGRVVRASSKSVGATPLITSRRATPAKMLEALEEADLVEARAGATLACSVDSLDSCIFTAGDSVEAIPRLFYEKEFYNLEWFRERWRARGDVRSRRDLGAGEESGTSRRGEEDVAYLDGPVAALGTLLDVSRGNVDRLFDYLEKNPIVRDPKNAFRILRKDGLIERTAKKRGNCAFSDRALCSFRNNDMETALWELYARRQFRGEWLASHSASDDDFNRWFERIRTRTKAFLAQTLLGDALWNPRELRMPLTARVAILGLIWVLVFPLVVLLSRSVDAGKVHERGDLGRSFSLLLIAITAVAFFELQPYLIFHWRYLDIAPSWSLIVAVVSIGSTLAAGPALAFFEKFGKKIVILLVSILGPLLPFVIYLTVMSRLVYSERWWTPRSGYALNVEHAFVLFAGAALVTHLFLLALDPNRTSIHDFYRDRLCKAYLVGSRAEGALIPNRTLALSQICPRGATVPYHLVNVALNLQGSKRADLRDRHSDFFIFSKYWVGGGKKAQYCRTMDMEASVPDLGLGAAMAVSGAAAAPNMGAFTMGPLVVLLALLNIRLGYWIPNPREVREWARARAAGTTRWLNRVGRVLAPLAGRFRLRPGPYLFLKELSSGMDDEGRNVNVSDGGHLENTAIFELLRRRCALIIAGDAEADRHMNFAGLATVIRYARIDLDVEIDIDVSDLRPREGKSRRQVAIGKITYPDRGLGEETGYLILLKASITGLEDPVVTEYRHRHPEFPHQSTVDQSFDEAQFEAYRALGFHVAKSLFADVDGKPIRQASVLEWVGSIHENREAKAEDGAAGREN
ncbi:MAG: patatin-like phospholipase family protein [Acidobacteriota bacterium]|nr:patatin-like phospholipase family protein [Acidobacteriota bacterium]